MAENDDVSLGNAADLAGLTSDEGYFLFDSTDESSPSKNYKTITKRLEFIRANRKLLKEFPDFKPLTY